MPRPPAAVLHVSSPRSWRGGEQQVAYLYAQLAARDVPQAILCPAGSAMERTCRERGYRHVAVPRRASVDPLFARGVARAARELGADLVHAHDPHAHTAAVLARTLFRCPADVIVHRRVAFPLGGGWFTRWKYDHPAVRRIVCVSAAIADVLRPAVRDPARLRVVHSGIDLARFARPPSGRLRRDLGLAPDEPIVANVAAIDRLKGYPTFVDVAARLAARGVGARFVAIGDGAERPRIEALVRERGLEGRVLFAGFRSDVAEILGELAVLLFPSELEGLGTTVLDAFACGVPVVASAVGGIPELVADGETGLLAPVNDAARFAEAVERLLRDRPLRDRVVAAARARVEAFSVSRTAEQILAIYDEVRAERARGRAAAGSGARSGVV